MVIRLSFKYLVVSMLKNELENAYAIAKKGDSVSALEICERLIAIYPEDKAEILRKMSHINAFANNIDDALSDRLEVIKYGSDSPQDYFFAGVFSLETQKYKEAIDLFSSAITLCIDANDKYYLEESYLLRAYAYVGINQYEKVLDDCVHVSDDIEYHIEGDGPITKKRLVSYVGAKELKGT